MSLQIDGLKLYYQRTAFYLVHDDVWMEIEEPIDWDKIDITIKFDKLTMAYKFEFTDGAVTLGFDSAAGFDLISDAYEELFERMNVVMVFGGINAANEFNALYVAKLNFSSYDEDKFVIRMNCERQSFRDKFRTRFDTSVDLFRTSSINGVILPILAQRELYLHPRILTRSASFDYDEAANGVEISLQEEFQDPEIWNTTVPPFKQLSNSVDGLQLPFAPNGELVVVETDTLPPGTSSRRFFFSFNGTFKFTMGNTSGFVQAGISVYRRSNVSIVPDPDFFPPIAQPGGLSPSAVVYSESFGNLAGTKTLNGSAQGSIEVGPDEAVFMKAWVFCPNNGLFVISDFQWLNTDQMSLTVNEQTVADPTTATGPMIHEAINRQLEIILDSPDPLRSNFLGRTDIGYAANGCGAFNQLMNGLMVRKFAGKPYNLSAADWFNSLSALYCMGLGIEVDDLGRETMRFEPAEYFFRDVLLFEFDIISDYNRSPAPDYIFNELEFGFDKYPQDSQDSSIEDWMTRMSYMPAIESVKNKLSKLCKFLLSPYYIEYTRQQAFAKKPTEQYETDTDTFMFGVRDGGVFTAVAMTSAAPTNKVTMSGIVALVKGDKFTISAATGSVVNGTYTVKDIDIPFAYTATIVTVQEDIGAWAGAGTVTIGDGKRMQAKRDEDFQKTVNVPFPKSVYNLEHHVKRIMLRWAKIFNAGLFKVFDEYVQFIEGKNNTTIYTQLKDSVTCRFGSVQEPYADNGSEITPSRMQLPLFKANLITFSAPLSWEGLDTFRRAFEGRDPDDKDYGYFQWKNPKGVTEKGYILEMKMNPVTQVVKCQMIQKYEDA